jgi:RNA polymerase sigma factor (sigma-70 family)
VSNIHPTFFDLVPSVVRVVMRRYRGWVEPDDLKQECYAWAAAKSSTFADKLNEEDDDKRKHNERNIGWQLKRVAERYARKEKAAKAGYQTTDEAYYETTTIAQLLPFVIASVLNETPLEQGVVMVDDGTPKKPSAPAESGNFLAILIDIKKAYQLLEQDDKKILELRYHDNWTLQQISEYLEVAISTADRRCAVAMGKLQNNLGGENPFA